MSDPRTTHGLGRHPNARFRCVVCRRFVKATERGVCPRCGATPPTLTETGRLDARLWRRAGHRMRAQNDRGDRASRWPWLLLIAAVAIAAASLLVR